MESKPCKFCGKPMYKGKFSAWNWERAKTHNECRGPWRNQNRRKATELDTCTRCGDTKDTKEFKRSKKSKKGYTQPCKACDSAKNKVGVPRENTKHLDPYLTIPWVKPKGQWVLLIRRGQAA